MRLVHDEHRDRGGAEGRCGRRRGPAARVPEHATRLARPQLSKSGAGSPRTCPCRAAPPCPPRSDARPSTWSRSVTPAARPPRSRRRPPRPPACRSRTSRSPSASPRARRARRRRLRRPFLAGRSFQRQPVPGDVVGASAAPRSLTRTDPTPDGRGPLDPSCPTHGPGTAPGDTNELYALPPVAGRAAGAALGGRQASRWSVVPQVSRWRPRHRRRRWMPAIRCRGRIGDAQADHLAGHEGHVELLKFGVLLPG